MKKKDPNAAQLNELVCSRAHNTLEHFSYLLEWGEVIEPGERASPRREVDSERINPALCQAFASGFARGMAWGWLYFKDITPELPVGLEMSIIITGEWNRLCCGS